MNLRAAIVVALSLLVGFGCATPRTARDSGNYTLVFLKTGPEDARVTGDDRTKVFDGHMANIQRLANERKLLVAGPFGKQRDNPSRRGLFVLDTADRAEAEQWASTDPAVKRGVFVLEYHDFATDAPLRAALERVLASQAAAVEAGQAPDPKQTMRGYVLLTAEHGTVALPELRVLSGHGHAFAPGALESIRAVAWLDAKDAADARLRYAEVLARIGKYELDDWFGSVELARTAAR
ncbi:MAG: hypothetical protein EPO68_01875 [Planctomycetota bacterium]|nr:MAG: hypothetical protein EPO68_01875 [Planctomycetota bacterium]